MKKILLLSLVMLLSICLIENCYADISGIIDNSTIIEDVGNSVYGCFIEQSMKETAELLTLLDYETLTDSRSEKTAWAFDECDFNSPIITVLLIPKQGRRASDVLESRYEVPAIMKAGIAYMCVWDVKMIFSDDPSYDVWKNVVFTEKTLDDFICDVAYTVTIYGETDPIVVSTYCGDEKEDTIVRTEFVYLSEENKSYTMTMVNILQKWDDIFDLYVYEY